MTLVSALTPKALSAVVALVAVPLALPTCARREPPAPDASPSIALPEPPAAAGVPAPSAVAAAPAGDASAQTPVDPSLLPQTREMPHASGPQFEARVAALWDAIVTDDPASALPAFFPLNAYKQVKDIADPAADWKRRLVAAFGHDIHTLHARLGDHAEDAKLVGMDVPESRARWVEPGEEYNKIGYYRVFASKLRYVAGGEGRSFDVRSLISWRGQWYVVHLSAVN